MAESMKFFMVEITYLVPADQLGDVVAEHRAFLQAGYDQGMLLMSGPQIPRTGGLVIARASSREAIEAFFRGDPYQVKGLASYRTVEFDPLRRQPFLENWVGGK